MRLSCSRAMMTIIGVRWLLNEWKFIHWKLSGNAIERVENQELIVTTQFISVDCRLSTKCSSHNCWTSFHEIFCSILLLRLQVRSENPDDDMSGNCSASFYGFFMDYCIVDAPTMRKVSALKSLNNKNSVTKCGHDGLHWVHVGGMPQLFVQTFSESRI